MHQLVHFVTLSEASADVRSILKRFIHELHELAKSGIAVSGSGSISGPVVDDNIYASDSVELLQSSFLDALRNAAKAFVGAPVFLFVDDVTGGLAYGAQSRASVPTLLSWIGSHLPEGVFLCLQPPADSSEVRLTIRSILHFHMVYTLHE